jgi:hypothetical protein
MLGDAAAAAIADSGLELPIEELLVSRSCRAIRFDSAQIRIIGKAQQQQQQLSHDDANFCTRRFGSAPGAILSNQRDCLLTFFRNAKTKKEEENMKNVTVCLGMCVSLRVCLLAWPGRRAPLELLSCVFVPKRQP